ncbi:MAG: hypothetical protein HY738_13915 [Bacteroidia bacterium]|nr:hypothetical protein [Bacteroidia bacterium]
MSTAEIKLDLFRRIDSLNEPELERIYKRFLALLNAVTTHHLSEAEKKAIAQALESSDKGEAYSHEQVMNEAREKYPNLRFR